MVAGVGWGSLDGVEGWGTTTRTFAPCGTNRRTTAVSDNMNEDSGVSNLSVTPKYYHAIIG